MNWHGRAFYERVRAGQLCDSAPAVPGDIDDRSPDQAPARRNAWENVAEPADAGRSTQHQFARMAPEDTRAAAIKHDDPAYLLRS